MKRYGIIGYPLSHSFSQKFFTEKFENEHIKDCRYEVFPLEDINDFPKLLEKHDNLCGLNVTIPHKVKILEYLDWCSDAVRHIGAANCIRISKESPVLAAFSGEVGIGGHNFRLEGFNTDVYGFQKSLMPLLGSQHQKALVLGDGGAAKAVKYVLKELEIEFKVVARKPGPDRILFTDLTPEIIKHHKLIINTTPVGTSPDVEVCPPLPYEALGSDHLLYDLIYNPDQTLFLRKGLEQGAQIKNGYEMLVLQAEQSWELWNSTAFHP
ncbi:shikimate dehydrogenase family protein [Mucilaginibacter sp. KACC 22063]|uniref:shikimate dehydrogenase family protein n=1 Tax=Mucilaginibacter sp. KACC 22063 TaxID=3025666 RepID=UPI002366C167|nr:shikimate dehydrogenase [Mucilaginibacter sp. KACC 22063]WDF55312.1 shikimate dehydrogenase [Mucilaginibacter sp. KACC 22063]